MPSNGIKTQTTSFWQNHIEQWKVPSLSKAAYCRQHQLPESSFSENKLQYINHGLSNMTQPIATGFASVQLVTPEPKQTQGLTLHFANGVRLSGISGKNVDVVLQLS